MRVKPAARSFHPSRCRLGPTDQCPPPTFFHLPSRILLSWTRPSKRVQPIVRHVWAYHLHQCDLTGQRATFSPALVREYGRKGRWRTEGNTTIPRRPWWERGLERSRGGSRWTRSWAPRPISFNSRPQRGNGVFSTRPRTLTPRNIDNGQESPPPFLSPFHFIQQPCQT